MKKLSFIILLLIIGYSIFHFGEKYLGVSVRRYGAPIDCKISTDIGKVIDCVNLNYMKFDAYMGDWNNNLSKNYINNTINKLYHDTNMSFSQFSNIKACSNRNDCMVNLQDKRYRIDTYQDCLYGKNILQFL